MNLSIKRILIGISIGIIIIALCIPAYIRYIKNKKEDVKLTNIDIWFFGEESNKTLNLLHQFELKNHNIRIRMRHLSWSGPHINEIFSAKGDLSPEIIQIGSTWINDFIQSKSLQRIGNDSISIWNQSLKETKFMVQPSQMDFVVPWYIEIRGLLYRKDILNNFGFTKFPKTYSNFLKMLKKLKAPDMRNETYYPLNFPYDDGLTFLIYSYARECSINDLKTGAGLNVFKDYIDLFKQGYSASTGFEKSKDPYEEFEKGNYLIFPGGPYNVKILNDYYLFAKEKWDVAPFPGKTKPSVFLGGSFLGIPSVSNYPEISKDLLTYLVTDKSQIELYLETGDLPAYKTPYTYPVLKNNDKVNKFLSFLPYVSVPENNRILTKDVFMINASLKNCILENKDTEEEYKNLSKLLSGKIVRNN